MIAAIVATAQNNVIGSNNDLPWYLPADLKHFKEITIGHTVVMGRKTFESILARLDKPLPNRENVVMTRNNDFSYEGIKVIHDANEISQLSGDIYIIGGAEVYRRTLGMVSLLYVTEVHAEIEGDVYFPELEQSEWRETSRETHLKDDKNPYDYDFVIYERTLP